MARLSGSTIRHALVAAAEAGLAAAIAWSIAVAVLPTDTPAYAPVAAVAVIGGGYDRRVERVRSMLGGMAIAIVLSEVGVRVLPGGVLSMAVVTAAAIVITRVLLDDTLAVVYAGFNAPILFGLGGEGWIPQRGIEAVIGGVTAFALIYLVFPPRVIRYAQRAIDLQVSAAVDSLRLAAAALEPEGDGEPAEADDLSEAIDRNVDAMNDAFGFSIEVARLSPWRRNQKMEVERAFERVRRLRPLLRTVTTAVRAADRMAADGPDPYLADVFELAADVIDAVGEVARTGPSEEATDVAQRVRDTAQTLSAHAQSDREGERFLRTTVAELLQLVANDAQEVLTELLRVGADRPRDRAAPASAGEDGDVHRG